METTLTSYTPDIGRYSAKSRLRLLDYFRNKYVESDTPELFENLGFEQLTLEELDNYYYIYHFFGDMTFLEYVNINYTSLELITLIKNYKFHNLCFDPYLMLTHYKEYITWIKRGVNLKLLNYTEDDNIEKLMQLVVTDDSLLNEPFLTDFAENIMYENYDTPPKGILTNYIDWRLLGQLDNEILLKHLVDVPVSYLKYINYCVKVKNIPYYLLHRLPRLNLNLFELLANEDKANNLDFIQFYPTLYFGNETLLRTVYCHYLKSNKNLNLPTVNNLRNLYTTFSKGQTVYSNRHSDSITAMLNFIPLCGDNLPTNSLTHSLLFYYFIKEIHQIDYLSLCNNYFPQSDGESDSVKNDFTKADAILICSELARELGLDYENIYTFLITNLDSIIEAGNLSNTFVSFTLERDIRCFLINQLLKGNNIFVYLELNLSLKEIMDLKVKESLLPKDFQFTSFAYRYLLELNLCGIDYLESN